MVSEGPKSLAVENPPQKIDRSDTKADDVETNSDKLAKPKTPTAENTEQGPEVSTSTADDVLLKKSPEETALILSAEEEAAELCANVNEEAVIEHAKPVNAPKPKKLKKDGSKSLWVSNISRSTKASDLKKLFSESFKVESAKIVTNGKSFFGYISLETADMVQKAVKDLNAFNLAGRMISVSFSRPDLKVARASVGEQMKRGGGKQKQLNLIDNQKAAENKQEENTDSSKKIIVKDSTDKILEKPVEKKAENKVIKSNPEEKQRKPQRQEVKADRRDIVIDKLKKELNTANSELRINKRRLRDSESRLEFERSRKSELISDVSKLEAQIKMERRKMEQEREQAEKKRKIDQSRFEDDKRILNKELDECKKLREYLQTKVDEIRVRHRSRSPIRRSPVRRAGPSGRSLPIQERPRMLHISPPKQRGYDSAQERQCIAPSPPKINRRSPTRRSRERSPPYKGIKKSRMDYPTSYSSGPSGGNKAPLDHYHTADTLDAPSRSASWTSSYKLPYRYTSTPGQSAYPLVGGEVMQPGRFNSTKPEYHEYNKRMLGVPRKY